MSFSAWVRCAFNEAQKCWQITESNFRVRTLQSETVEQMRQMLALNFPNFDISQVQFEGADHNKVIFVGQLFDESDA
jgi:hypothetical protein